VRHKLSTAQYAQGWLGGQIGSAVAAADEDKENNPTAAAVANEVAGQWKIVDEAMDDLIKENLELKRRLSIIESAFS
jgi:hypothetical protein